MKISGYTFVRNATKLYYPVAASISSILPICSEFVVALGKGDDSDRTREEIEAIDSPKIRIIDTKWNPEHFKRGAVNSIQSDIAKAECSGDWAFYLQADEVIHEKYLPAIERRCRELLNNDEVEGLLFRYKHFWGDYSHYVDGHGWYPSEIRIVRNLPQIRSWHSAQSFRFYERYSHPWQTTDVRKLHVARVEAEVFHYGWVRPPHLMQKKNKALNVLHAGENNAESRFSGKSPEFCYGDLEKLPVFGGSHPAVMKEWIEKMDWSESLKPKFFQASDEDYFKHLKLKNRILSWLEKRFNDGERLFCSKNYRLNRHL